MFRGRFDIDVRSSAIQVKKLQSIRPAAPVLATAFATIAVATVFVMGLSRPTVAIERDDFEMFPLEVEGWSGSRRDIPSSTEGVLDADDYILIDFSNAEEAAAVNFWAAYYYRQDRKHRRNPLSPNLLTS